MGERDVSWLLVPLLVLVCLSEQTEGSKHRGTALRRADRPSPPLGLRLEALNCTAFRARWGSPRRGTGITGYTAMFTEVSSDRVASPRGTQALVFDRSHRGLDRMKDTQTYEMAVGGLLPGTTYRVLVKARGPAGEGRPSLPKNVTTEPPDRCSPPDAPSRPEAAALSDSEVALSWKAGSSAGSSPLRYYMVEVTR
ncbi:pikachurin-like [Rhinoraja longicauda]